VLNVDYKNRYKTISMFIYMVAIYGVLLALLGALGNEAELVAVGLFMIFIGNLHQLSKALLKIYRKNIYRH